ncbi:MAG: TetR/AcrR family transcriptional regulator [Acidobacteria bacterium]|nr:TetR/AcrR family transcriptional regulator [Acidobacteriota bacterium]
MGRRDDHANDTRQALLTAARALFATKGYAETATEDVVRAARVTRGALYHHFRGKEELFRTVVTEVVADAVDSLTGPAERPLDQGRDAWDAVIAGCHDYLDLCLQPQYSRILLVDGPAILGFQAVSDLSEAYGGEAWERVLRRSVDSGVIVQVPVETLAHLLASLVTDAAIRVNTSANPRAERAACREVLTSVMEGLRATPVGEPTSEPREPAAR